MSVPDYDHRVAESVQSAAHNGGQANAEPTSAEFSFWDICIVLVSRRKLILKVTGVCAAVSIIGALLLPNWYTARSTILPPQQPQSVASSLISSVGALAGLASKDLGLKNSADVYVAMLESQTVQDSLVKRFDLQSVYKQKKLVDARKALDNHSRIESTKRGLIAVAVEDKDPRRAADIANAYIDELHGMTVRLAIGEAGQRRLFFEQQLRRAKDDLANAEVAFKQTEEKTGLMQMDAQARTMIATISQLKGQIAAKEIELQAMKSFATAQNPDLQMLNEQLAGMRQQLAKLLQNTHVTRGDVEIPSTSIPEAGIEYIRRYRDLKYYETIYDLIAKQYEVARLDEAKSAPVIQAVDVATVPEKKSGPWRSLIVVLTTLSALFLACVWVLLSEMFRAATQDPKIRGKIELLKIFK